MSRHHRAAGPCSHGARTGRRDFLKGAALGAAAVAGALHAGCEPTKEGGAAKRPNLLVVFADQMRGTAMGCAGNPDVRTPHLDRLAAEGLRFSRAYANCPVCTPNRGTLLTGRYPHAHGAVANDLPLPEGQVTLAEVLRGAGYRTGYVGKWHLDGVPRDRFTPPGPRRQGFDFWAAWNCAHSYFKGRVYRDSPEPIPLEGYEPVGQTDLALEFLRTQDARPWCLVLSWGPPHDPYEQVPEPYRAMYDPARIRQRPNVRPDPPPRFKRGRAFDPRCLADYYAHITALDHEFGRLMDALRGSGAEADTLVVFTSDHGDMLWSQGMINKEQPWEESVGVPLVARWPGRVPAGKASEALASTVDLAPTLLALTGVAAPAGMQGTDLSRAVRTGSSDGPADVLLGVPVVVDQGLALGIAEWRGLRTDRYTYARWWDGSGWMLYDNEADRFQANNLIGSAAHRRLRLDLETRLRERLAAVGDECLPWQDTLRGLGLVDLWNARERTMHARNPRLLG